MSTRIGAGAITPVVSSASAQVVAGPAIPVYVYTSVPSNSALRGGRSLPVKFITSGDLVQNGGQYQLAAQYSAMPVIVVAGATYGVQGGVAIPVYDVTNLNYPPPVVIPPPASIFPPVTTGLLLNLQVDTLVGLGSNDPVTAWANAGSAGGTFTTDNVSPHYEDISGNPFVDFLSTQGLVLGAGPSASLDDLPSMTIFAVCQKTGLILTKIHDKDFAPGFYAYASNGSTQDHLYFQDDGDNFQLDVAHTNVDSSVFRVVTYELLDRNTLVVRENGDDSDQNSSNSYPPVASYASPEPVRVGRMASGQLQGNAGAQLQALMLYAPALSPADRATMEAALMAKYGI